MSSCNLVYPNSALGIASCIRVVNTSNPKLPSEKKISPIFQCTYRRRRDSHRADAKRGVWEDQTIEEVRVSRLVLWRLCRMMMSLSI